MDAKEPKGAPYREIFEKYFSNNISLDDDIKLGDIYKIDRIQIDKPYLFNDNAFLKDNKGITLKDHYKFDRIQINEPYLLNKHIKEQHLSSSSELKIIVIPHDLPNDKLSNYITDKMEEVD